MSDAGWQAGSVVERSHEALQDNFLRGAVRFTTDRLKGRKSEATSELGDWEQWRERGQAIRSHTVTHLDYYLAQFCDRVREAGGHVHFADDAAEAAMIVMQIVDEKKAKTVVKSKSMVSEEIHVNHHLLQAGVRAIETDLGEYIVQLAGQAPSHIIIPAIHKTREQIRDLFVGVGATDLTTDTAALAAFARRTLRQEFLQAEVGLTGCNFGIAESGSVALFSNEGNGRMVSTLPRTQIVTMGMERILPTFADLEVMANLLPRSATGQKLTAYLSLITGPRREGEGDGPDELHIVILDNGRSRQLGDPDMQAVLHCIRCGACLNVCPVYRHIGGHAYGSVYPGPIGAVLSPLLQEGDKHADLPFASSLCGACYEACPVKIPLHDMLVTLRARYVARGKASQLERVAFRGYRVSFATPRRYKASFALLRVLQRGLAKGNQIDAQVGPLRGWTASRSLPAVAAHSFRSRFAEIKRELDVDDRGQGLGGKPEREGANNG